MYQYFLKCNKKVIKEHFLEHLIFAVIAV